MEIVQQNSLHFTPLFALRYQSPSLNLLQPFLASFEPQRFPLFLSPASIQVRQMNHKRILGLPESKIPNCRQLSTDNLLPNSKLHLVRPYRPVCFDLGSRLIKS
jgi:hypothetical protein